MMTNTHTHTSATITKATITTESRCWILSRLRWMVKRKKGTENNEHYDSSRRNTRLVIHDSRFLHSFICFLPAFFCNPMGPDGEWGLVLANCCSPLLLRVHSWFFLLYIHQEWRTGMCRECVVWWRRSRVAAAKINQIGISRLVVPGVRVRLDNDSFLSSVMDIYRISGCLC